MPCRQNAFKMTTPRCTLTWKQRHTVSRDTIARSANVAVELEAQGATLASTFISDQLPPLPTLSDIPNPKPVSVVNSDSFTIARRLISDDPHNATGKTAVLNLASDQRPGGGWDTTLSKTQVCRCFWCQLVESSWWPRQEEALCYSSTLFSTLSPSYYPWPNLGPGSIAGVFSPGVVIFKHDLDHDCVDLPNKERCVVSVLTVVAPCGPELTKDEQGFAKESDLQDLREKIRLVYRMAGWNDQEFLVLGVLFHLYDAIDSVSQSSLPLRCYGLRCVSLPSTPRGKRDAWYPSRIRIQGPLQEGRICGVQFSWEWCQEFRGLRESV